MLDITFSRHGESDGNAAGFSQGFSQGYLTQRGKNQATALGKNLFLSSETPRYDAIWSSDLTRVIETCRIALSVGSTDISIVKFSPLLREKNAGIFEGKPKILMRRSRAKSKEGERDFRPRNGESWNDLLERVKSFVDSLLTECRAYGSDKMKVLIFTSGGFIKEFINAFVLKNNGDSNHYYPNKAKNGSVYRFEMQIENCFDCRMIVENSKVVEDDR